jgi:multidrug resistance efflux pump
VLDNAKLQLQYTKIVAPMGGRTGALLVHPGAPCSEQTTPRRSS